MSTSMLSDMYMINNCGTKILNIKQSLNIPESFRIYKTVHMLRVQSYKHTIYIALVATSIKQ